MKSAILLFTMLLLLVSSAFAQDMTFVLKQSGDSLWVKDDADFSGQNTLYSLMNSDSLAPASRVYVLHNGGVYSIVNNSTGSANHQTIIMGETNTSLKTSTGGAPPILQGAVYQGGSSTGGFSCDFLDFSTSISDIRMLGATAETTAWPDCQTI